jgi:hypothetical protein
LTILPIRPIVHAVAYPMSVGFEVLR